MGRPRTLTVVLVALAATGLVGCSKAADDGPGPGGTPSSNASASLGSIPSTVPVTGGSDDWCAVLIKAATDVGYMVNKHVLPPDKITFDMLKAYAPVALALRDQLLTGVPANIKAALEVTLQYFQALKDNNYSQDTPIPAGLVAASNTVNAYETARCGIVFDQ